MRRRLARLLRHPWFLGCCLALSIAAWIVQLRPMRSVFWISPRQSIEAGIGGGGVWLWSAGAGDFSVTDPGFHTVDGSPRAWIPEFRIDRGLTIVKFTPTGSRSSTVDGVHMHLPGWIAGAVFAVPPVMCACRWRRRRPGCCACGYELSGLRDARCPECGRELAT